MKEQLIPAAAIRDPNSVEMLRVWIAENHLHGSLKIGMYHEATEIPESRAWGKILADATRHIAAALEARYKMDGAQVQAEIRDEYLDELGDPTSDAVGDFVDRQLS